jgi:hypothetical protein
MIATNTLKQSVIDSPGARQKHVALPSTRLTIYKHFGSHIGDLLLKPGAGMTGIVDQGDTGN